MKNDGRVTKVIYYVMNLADYGELFNFLKFTPKFEEVLARYFFK
jgi:hypothetical protein